MLFDTNAWVEYFNGSEKGAKVRELAGMEMAYTAVVTVSELASWALRNNHDSGEILMDLKRISVILPLTEDAAKYAGEMHFRYKKEIKDFGMVDSMIYATALSHGLKLVTGDRHFEGKMDVEMI